MLSSRTTIRKPARNKQHGAALMVMLVIMIMGTTAFLVSALNSSSVQIERDKKTADALAQAKEALKGRAVSDANRPGSLPCPDTTNDGQSDSCSSSNFIGRLPWKTLGIPELRDGNSEDLWYALASNFRDTSSIINSDTSAQLSVSGTNEIVAIIFSPGSPLISQQRGSTAITCPTDGLSHPANQCASNYLEGENANNDTVFISGAVTNTFNDRLLTISTDQLLPLVEKRLAKEISSCVADYATNNGYGRYPWSTQLDPTQNPTYDDKDTIRFGRLPDFMGDTQTYGLPNNWPGGSPACQSIFTSGGWWMNTNWRELIFYSIANKYRPKTPLTTPTVCTTTCLSVNPPSAIKEKKVVIIFAGKKLTGQNRGTKADKADSANYLEGNNATGGATGVFEQHPRSNTFNDTVLFQ
jgi:type II secretory pathway pseudopilin PulG